MNIGKIFRPADTNSVVAISDIQQSEVPPLLNPCPWLCNMRGPVQFGMSSEGINVSDKLTSMWLDWWLYQSGSGG